MSVEKEHVQLATVCKVMREPGIVHGDVPIRRIPEIRDGLETVVEHENRPGSFRILRDLPVDGSADLGMREMAVLGVAERQVVRRVYEPEADPELAFRPGRTVHAFARQADVEK